MTFVCARCRYRVALGYGPWDDCPVCASVGYVFDKLPPYVPDYRPKWRTPVIFEYHEKVYPYKHTWSKPRVWWPMRERLDQGYWPILGEPQWNYEGSGDPQLSFECFSDFTYSPELRTQMREQVSVAISLMPEMDDIEVPNAGVYWMRWKKRKNRKH